MSYNGSGTFLINSAGQPVVANTVISATVFNSLTADLATGLSTAITKDGQTTVTANIPFGNNKITTLGAGTAATDAANLGQVQSTAAKLITVTGTDTITGSMSPQLTAYAAGQLLYFIANAANTGAVTINVDGLGAKAITRDGSTALAAGDINSGEVVVIVYDGTRFQMINAANSFGNTTINGTLTVTGNTGLQANVSITSALSVGGTFNVTGAATLGSTLSVTGKSDLPTVSTASINAAVAVVTTGTVTNLTSTSASIASANAAVALVTTGTVTNLTSTSASIASANLGTAVVTGLTVTGASIASVNVGAAVLSGNLTLSSGTAGGVVYLDGSKVATSGSALTFDGSTLTNTGNSTGTIFNTIVNTDAAGSSITDERIVFAMGGSLGFGVTGWANAGIIEATSTGGLYLGAYNGPINFSSGASARNINMTLTASGDLGIGTTSPAAKLQVVTSSGVAQIITNSDATNGFGLKITAGGSASARYALHVLDPTDTTSYFKISTETGAVGNVGIGTASPAAKLDVNGTIRSGTGSGETLTAGSIDVGKDIGLANGQGIVIGGARALTFTTAGNLGLGVTPSAWSGSYYKAIEGGDADNQGAIAFRTDLNGVELFANAYFDGTNNIYKFTGAASVYQNTNGNYKWFIAPSGTAGNAITFTQAMTLDASGNLGIGGTASAFDRVTVTGTLPSSSAFSIGFGSRGTIPSTSTSLGIGFSSVPSTQAASFTLSELAGFYAGQGSFGAGSSVTSQFGFYVANTLTGATNNYGFYSNIASGSNRWNFYSAGSAENYFAGAVGIGTAPLTTLHVFTASTTAGVRIQRFAGNYYSELRQTDAQEGLAFLVGDGSTVAERLRIKGTGQTRFQPRAGNPGGAEAGDVYYDSNDNKLKVYNGTSWVDLH